MSIPVPHDAIFKKFLGNITVARDFLQIHLPDIFRQMCDLSTLVVESGSFIEDDLQSQFSDMLYSLQARNGKDCYIYCLVEHQSSPDEMMPLRMAKYCLAAMQRHLEKGNKKLPLIIPMMFYHGKQSPYPHSTRLLDCFDDPEQAELIFREAFPVKPFPLIDITVIPDEEILTHKHVAILELVLKNIRSRDMLELVKMIAGLLNQWPLGREQSTGLWHYIAEAGNTSDVIEFLHNIAKESPEQQEEIMTIAEQLKQIGKQEGRQEGIQIGEQKGRKDEALTIARRLVASGVDRSVIKMSTGLSDAEIDKLR